jgi:DNA-binding transcriptional LysR family regulator
VELRHLRYFVAVAEMENVSKAALKLHVSQPALSRQIRDLEEEIGFLLLERTAKSVRLTDAGRVFLDEARGVLAVAEEAVAKARAVAKKAGGELRVGYSPTPTARILPETLRLFQGAMPQVRVKLHDWSNHENLVGLRDGRLDLAFLVRPAKAAGLRQIRFEELRREGARLAVSPKHRFARQRLVSLKDAGREPFVAYSKEEYPDYHEYLNAVFAGMKLRVVEEHDGASSLLQAIEAGAGVALVTESFSCGAGPRVKVLGLDPEPAPSIIGIASREGKGSPPAEKFWECARSAAGGRKV